MAESDEQLEINLRADPAHDQLFREIGLVRTRGIENLEGATSDLPGLFNVALVIGSGTDEADKIEDALRQAVQRLGGIGTSAIEALLELTPDTCGLGVTERRGRAAVLYDHKSYEFFRTRVEPSLLMFVATYLRVIVDEQRLAERERTLIISERPPGSRLLDKVSDEWAKNFALRPETKPEPLGLPSIYHLKFRRDEYPPAWAYTINVQSMHFQADDNPSLSRIKRILKRPNRRYYLVSSNARVPEAGFYRPPNWFTRIYRALIIRLL